MPIAQGADISAVGYEDSEQVVFELIYEARGSEVSPPQLHKLWRQNQSTECTCSARAVLERGRMVASTQPGAYPTSDSGYSAPEEHPPAEGPTPASTKHSDLIPQEQDGAGIPAVDIPTTARRINAGTAGECEGVETKETQTASGSVDPAPNSAAT